MAVINGTGYAVFNGTERLWSCDSCGLNVDVDLAGATTKEDGGWEKHINGLRKWSIDFSGVYEDLGGSAELMTPAEILAAIIARTADADVAFKPTAGTTTTGWKGNATFQSIKIDAPLEQPIKFSGTIVGNAPLTVVAIA